MVRRILITLCIAALGFAAWWITSRDDAPSDGLVVHVRVQDANSAAIPGAQVQGVYAPGWRPMGKDGNLRLTRVLLRAEEEPSAEAIATAIQVRAPFYTQRRGAAPKIERRPDGSWQAHFRLQHHGVFRLAVGETHLGSVKAFLEPDENWEAMDRGNVARPDSPATYRIYPGMKRLVVRLEGEPDQKGVVQAATRRYVFPVPAPGFIVEESVEAGEVKPILGRVEAPAGDPEPPSLMGTATITGIESDGTRVDYGEVAIDHGGSFIIRTLGDGDYMIGAVCPYLGLIPTELVAGGGDVTLRANSVGHWLVVEHPGLPNAKERNAEFSFSDTTFKIPPGSILYGKGRTTLPKAGSGDLGSTYKLTIDVPGTDDHPPLAATDFVEHPKGNAGWPIENVSAVLKPVPSGTVLIRVAREALTASRGAAVRVGDRSETTLLAKLAEEATFKNVAAGEVTVTVDWNLDGQPPTTRKVIVKPDETTTVEFDHDA